MTQETEKAVTRRARGALVGLLVLAAGGVVGLQASRSAAAGPALCPSPVVTGVVDATTNAHFGVPGTTTVTVQGVGFTGNGCTTSVTFGVPGHSTVITGSALTVANTGTSITFTEPTGPGGPVAVTLTDAATNTNTSNSNYNFWAAPTGSITSSPTPYEASTVTVSGTNFTFGATVSTPPTVAECDGKDPSESPTVTLVSDTALTFTAPAVYCAGPVALSFSAPYNTAAASSDGPVVIPLALGNIDIGAHVTSFDGTGPLIPGSAIRLAGNGFGPKGTVALGGAPLASTWSDSSVSVVLPDTDSGPLTYTRAADSVVIAHPNTTILAAITTVSPTTVVVGDTVTITGMGFGTKTGTVTVSGTSAVISSWSPKAVTITVPVGAASGPLQLTPVANAPPGTSALTVVPHIAQVTPATGAAGSLVEVLGSSFGSTTGSVTVGGAKASVTLWSDGRIILTIPSGLHDGPATVAVTTAGSSPQVATSTFTVSAAAGVLGAPPGTPGAPGSAGGSTAPGGGFVIPKNGKPIVTTGPVNFTPPVQNGPVVFSLAMARRGQPGTDLPYTAALTAFGAPVPGAPLQVEIALEPATDAYLVAGTSKTDADGQVHGFIHLSTTPGVYLIYLKSGAYQYEVELTADSSAPATAGIASFVEHLNAPSTLALFGMLIPAIVALLAFSRGRGLAVAGGPTVPAAVIPGRRALVGVARGAAGEVWRASRRVLGAPGSALRSWYIVQHDAIWRVLQFATAVFLILMYLLASVSTLVALPLTFFGTSTPFPEGTIYLLASIGVSLALTAIAIRYVYYYRCWAVSRSFFDYPKLPDLDELSARDIPFMKVQVTTKGGAVPVVERSLAELEQILVRNPWLRDVVTVEIITENGDEAEYLAGRFAATALKVDAVTLPPDYETPNGTRLKARALQYMVERRRAGWNKRPGRTYIVHFDEETLVSEAHLLVLADYLSRDPRPVSQGPILYPLEWRKTPWICRALECTRPFGCSECARVMENPPPPHLHGSNLVVEEEAENAIGWDFGTIDGQPFIAEDLLFGLRAFSVLGRDAFGWHGATMLEQPPLSLHWAIQQRLRWVMGALQGMRAMMSKHEYDGISRTEKRRLMTSIGYRIATYSLGFPVGFAGLYFVVHPAETSTNWGSFAGLWRVLIIASAIGWILSYQIGIARNLRYQAVGNFERMRQGAVMLVLTPIAGLCETVGPFIALLRWLFGARRVSWTPTPKVSDKRPVPTGPTVISTGAHGESESIPQPDHA